MQGAISKADRLRAFIDDFHDGKQKNLAEAYDVSPSVVSGWLKEEGASNVPAYMEKIIELTRQVAELSKELKQTKIGRAVQMKSGFAVVRFPDSKSPGVIVCKGVPDLDTANGIINGLFMNSEVNPTSEKKEL